MIKLHKKGFIATSLIYSFFLVFIAIIAALLNNYIANKTIQDRYNLDTKNDLNNKRYSVKIYSKNSNIINGMTLSNLIGNGDFSNASGALTYWQKCGSTPSYGFTPFKERSHSIRKMNGNINSFMYQEVTIKENSKYYIAVDSALKSQNELYIGSYQPNVNCANSSSSDILLLNPSIDGNQSWTKQSHIYTGEANSNMLFVLGKNRVSSEAAYFTNVLLVNLTDSFGEGNEPVKSWLDTHLDWFDGTRSFIALDNIKQEEEIAVRFNPYTAYTEVASKVCKDLEGNILPEPRIEAKVINSNGIDITYQELVYDSVSSDMNCYIEWRESV